jgi:serine/threonine protein kinase
MSQKMDHGPRSPLRNGLVANDDNDDIFTPQKQLTVPSNRSTNDSILSAVSEQPNLASFESQKATDQRSVTPQLPSLNEKTERSYGGALSRTEESISFSDDYSDMYTTPTPESPSSRLLNKRYEIVRRIGRGAFGVVQLVKDTKTGNEYALKMIECTDMMELNRAMQEVFPVKDISHEGLVRYLDVFVHEDKDSTGTVTTKFCILMNYYSEGDMLQMIEKRFAKEEYFDEKQALSYMKQLAEGVHHLHQKTLIHRDLKPQNVFVANNEKSLFIGDFGLVTKLEKTFLSTVAGTLRFMAPEVLSNKKYEYAADVWSLGCIFYELLTLRLDRNMYMDVFSKPDFYRDLIKEIKDQLGYSQDLSRLLVDMFEIQPGLRVTTEQVLKRIEKMQKGEYSETKEDTLMCEGECGKIAHVECVGCKSFLCNNCFSDSHKFGAMKKHEKIALNVPNIDWDEKEKKKKKEPTPLVIDSNAPETSWGAMRRDKKEKSYSEQKSKYDDEDVGEKEKPKKKSMAVSSKKERKKNSDEATPTFFENVPKKSLNYDYMDKEDEDDDDGSINDDLYESDDDDDEMIRQISGPINVGFTGSNRKAPAKPMPQQVQKLSKKK